MSLTDADLAAYRARHPHLFPQQPARADLQGTYLPASRSNGYSSEAEFQADVVRNLEAFGWHVQESLKGSARGGQVFYTVGFPDLQIYRAPRRMTFIELKQPGNRPSEAQLACHARLREAGYAVTVAYTLAQALAAAAEELCRA